MARWKLMVSHYLNVVEDWNWEYNETDRKTGRAKRVQFPVPRFLDVDDPLDWTQSMGPRDSLTGRFETGEIIVCLEGKGNPTDIEFIGDPTPDMSPLDDEAHAITKAWEAKWNARPEDIASHQGFSQSMVDRIMMKPEPTEVKGLDSLVASIAALAQNQAALIEALAKPQPRRL